MKVLSVFNNKGGVGKTTLAYHLGNALSELGHKVLMIDADPQCNLTIYSIKEEIIHKIWEKEDLFIDEGFESEKKKLTEKEFFDLNNTTRSLHYLVKPTEEGTGELGVLPPPYSLSNSLDIIPGRLTLHLFEEKIAGRWTDLYRGEPLALRTITKIREIAELYSEKYNYDYVIVDTSPSLGALNKSVISTVDGFFVPALPDLFSLYGIKNIGKALASWKSEFDVIYKLISSDKRKYFPKRYVTFLGYTIYNAKKYTNSKNEWNLAEAHYNYAKQIPRTIKENIGKNLREHLSDKLLAKPIGGDSIMLTHNTFPSMAQYYHLPMWKIPDLLPNNVDKEHANTLRGASKKYGETKAAYQNFCDDLIKRINLLGD
ncbi:TPA: ParA family protein [Yersinia enterocolitica]|uniref:ParA family protein n=1 Tax=Yersinia enterocolitica TaxID=630 RepID=UPI0005FCEC37|nr:ParA family protein [Yersinia enterocolitica]EKN5932265.1 ParA family protein [Yersinia enterocolitica]ELY5259885.1 ParA family protein [Yersinia enterocolitica]CRE74407.1 plasmid partitioning protein [Yersinia enterocolitica]HDL6627641.1 ParA family protein [Yersinia enterocolitica]HDL6655759.1 ParA family protein [Yersinia enterocolitica]